jgi:hypothetical protein
MSKWFRFILLILVLSGCVSTTPTETVTVEATIPPSAVPSSTPLPPAPTLAPTPEPSTDGFSDSERATLESLTQVDDFPLYTMTYHGEYDDRRAAGDTTTPWACSLFAALGDADNMVYGRNFDWHFSPAVLLFTDPPGGYASVSMVDIAYLGFAGESAYDLTERPIEELEALLDAPFLPFDGVNEAGLAIGFAAVPPGGVEPDPDKETVDSLMIVRMILDQASDVDEALTLFGSYNIDWTGGPPLHYLVADRSGHSVLVEFYAGEMVVRPNEADWQVATNFIRARAGESAEGWCWRYDRITRGLAEAEGRLTAEGAMTLLEEASQPETQWSIVYGMTTGEVAVSMGQEYETVHTFDLDER